MTEIDIFKKYFKIFFNSVKFLVKISATYMEGNTLNLIRRILDGGCRSNRRLSMPESEVIFIIIDNELLR